MEALRQDLEAAGTPFHAVAINMIGVQSSMDLLTAVCSFDCLQDMAEVGAWSLMGGKKDDLFVFRPGGRLAAGGYLPIGGAVDTVLSGSAGYANLRAAILAAAAAGPGDPCPADPPAGGAQRPGDLTQDGGLDIADPIALLAHLFGGAPAALPCDAGTEGNRDLLDANGDGTVDISDAVHLLGFLFIGGPPPGGGASCGPIRGCPDACAG